MPMDAKNPQATDLEAVRAAAHRAWQENMSPDTEKALERATDALRWARQDAYASEGVTNAGLRETSFKDDEDEQ